MKTALTVIGIIAIIIIIILGLLYFFGSKAQKKMDGQQAAMEAAAQTVSMLVIDKKKMKLKEANLPKVVLEQTPKYLRGSKVPIVKAKIGPNVMTLICDAKIFELVPVKKEVKATISGIYITDVKGVRGTVLAAPAKKKGLLQRFKKSDNKETKTTENKKAKK